MAEGTVRGTFDLNVPARRKLRELREEAGRTNVSMQQLGRSMDRIGGRDAEYRIDRYRRQLRGLTRDLFESGREAEKLNDRLNTLDRRRVAPQVDVRGIAAAITQLELLEKQLDRVDRRRAVATAGVRGGGGGLAGAAGRGGAGGAGRGLRSVGLGPFNLGSAAGLGTIAAALPAVEALAGAAGALTGTVLGGTAAAGAGAVAGGGALATGLGTIAAVAIPAKKNIEAATKAQQQYTTAVRQFGSGSTEAVRAKFKMDEAFRRSPRGTRGLLREAHEFQEGWRRATRDAQGNLLSFLRSGVAEGRRLTPTLGAASTRTTGALARETPRFTRGLFERGPGRIAPTLGGRQRGPVGRLFISQSAGMFDENLTQVRRFTQFGTQALMQLSIAARPFLLDATRFMANWSKGWAESTSNIDRTRTRLHSYVEDFIAIRRLAGAIWRLLRDLLLGGGTRQAGRSMIDQLTAQLNTWDRWVQRNPGQVRDFFRRTVHSTVELAKALFQVARELGKIGGALLPILDRFSQLATFAGNIGLLQPGALAAAYGAYRGTRGLGRGGAAAGPMGGAAVVPVGGMRPQGVRGARPSMGSEYRAGRQLYGSRTAAVAYAAGTPFAAAGGAARGALAGAGRAYLPIAAVLAGLGFAGTKGGIGNRLGGALQGLGFNAQIDPGRAQQRQMAREGAGPVARANVRRAGGLGRIGAPTSVREARSQIAGVQQVMTDPRFGRPIGPLAAQLRQVRQEAERTLNFFSRGRGARFAQQFSRAFDFRRAHGQSPVTAMRRTSRDILSEMRHLRPAGARVLGQNSLAWARQMARGNPRMLREVNRLQRGVVDYFRRMGKDVAVINGQILVGTNRIWPAIEKGITDPLNRAKREAGQSFEQIYAQAIRALMGMGFGRGEARSLIQATAHGGQARDVAGRMIKGHIHGPTNVPSEMPRQTPGRRQQGGRIPGRGFQDTVAVAPGYRAAPGELIVNRHTERDHDSDAVRFGLPTLAQRIRHETRRHSQQPQADEIGRGRLGRAAATGTLMGVASRGGGGLRRGGFHPELHPGIRRLAQVVVSRYPGLAVTSTTGGNHVAGSYHYRGMAADIGGAPGLMNTAAGWVGSRYGRSLAEGIHNPNLAIKDGRRVSGPGVYGSVWAGHRDHIHLAVAGALAAGGLAGFRGGGGGAAQQMKALRAPRTRQRGIPGALSQRSGDIYASALTKRVNRRLARMGGGGTGVGGQGPPGHHTYSLGELTQLARSVGMANPGLMARIAMAESGGREWIVNSIGATGLWQIYNHPDLVRKYGSMRNARNNALAARDLLGSQGLGAWAASRGAWGRQTGGRIPWFRHGVEGLARRPGVIGVGDRVGGEDVQIRPHRPTRRRAGRGAGGGVHVNVNLGGVTVHGERDVKKMADKIGHHVAEKVINALDDAVPDEALT